MGAIMPNEFVKVLEAEIEGHQGPTTALQLVLNRCANTEILRMVQPRNLPSGVVP
jgi:hypothetical protein